MKSPVYQVKTTVFSSWKAVYGTLWLRQPATRSKTLSKRSNIVWIFFASPVVPTLKSAKVRWTPKKRFFFLLFFCMVQTGFLYNEKISRNVFFFFETYHSDTWYINIYMYQKTMVWGIQNTVTHQVFNQVRLTLRSWLGTRYVDQ